MYDAEYLSLEDLLDQDLSAYEFFQTLSPEAQALLEGAAGGRFCAYGCGVPLAGR